MKIDWTTLGSFTKHYLFGGKFIAMHEGLAANYTLCHQLEGLDREQLNKLDKETLIEVLLNALSRIDELEKQVAA